jgi:hypothetical protein
MTLSRIAPMALLFVCALALPAQGQEQELTEEQAVEAMDFAMHDAAFTLYHEIGHMLVGELGLPVLGKEEDAADALAAIMLLNDTGDEVESFNTLIDSADGWYFNAVKSTGSGVEDLSFYDEHSLDIQRAYAMVCMMVGADPDEFKETADIYELDADRQEACADTYGQANEAWNTLLEPHLASGGAGADITVIYEDAGDYGAYADELKSREVLEKAAALVTSKYALPGPITFRGKLCGEANAFYSPSESEITYCYELAEDMYGLYVTNVLAPAEDTEEPDAETSEDAKERGGTSAG